MTLTEQIQAEMDKMRPGDRLVGTTEDGGRFVYYYHPVHGPYLEEFVPAGAKLGEEPPPFTVRVVE